jgi:hypothetical protein
VTFFKEICLQKACRVSASTDGEWKQQQQKLPWWTKRNAAWSLAVTSLLLQSPLRRKVIPQQPQWCWICG